MNKINSMCFECYVSARSRTDADKNVYSIAQFWKKENTYTHTNTHINLL